MRKNITILAVGIMVVAAGLVLSPILLRAETTGVNPLAATIVQPTAGKSFLVGETVHLLGQASGGNATHYAYLWNFSDGNFGAGPTFAKSYSTAGLKLITLTVTDFDGHRASASVSININSTPPPPLPMVDLKANGSNGSLVLPVGTNLGLSWISANVTACTATASPTSSVWTGTRVTSGSQTITPVPATPGNYVYTLTCNGVSDSVTVTVPTPGVDQLVISDVRVMDITQTSAVIHWTTSLPATSRVIYDTVSHPTIDTVSGGPNYGYANSTPTTDTDPKVTEHAVTLTGLTANTQYFFRVISQS